MLGFVPHDADTLIGFTTNLDFATFVRKTNVQRVYFGVRLAVA